MSVEGAYRAEDYIYIKAWGALAHASPAHVRMRQALAAAERAPLDALFKYHDSDRWVVLSEMPSRMRGILEGLT